MKGNSGIFIFSKEGLGACYFGSVARNMVRMSPVPVLTVNPYKVK